MNFYKYVSFEEKDADTAKRNDLSQIVEKTVPANYDSPGHVGSVNLVESVSSDYNNPAFPGAQIDLFQFNLGRHDYISDVITLNFLDRFFKKYGSVGGAFLSAQMGRGKTYLVNYTLRGYALEKGKKVLYLCNRNALSKQQVKAVHDAVNPALPFYWGKDQTCYTEGSISVMTYQRYYMEQQDKRFAQKYNFVVADEAHFFYADSRFNADSEKILFSIVKNFQHAFRLWITATPEKVYDLIYAAEFSMHPDEWKGAAGKNIFTKKFIKLDTMTRMPALYFEWDMTSYQQKYFFTKNEKIIDHMRTNASEMNKYVVFVDSKMRGQNMQQQLQSANISCTYIDRSSRTSLNIDQRHSWEKLLETGKFDTSVLITTSVLDNGFSIHDKAVKNIVLMADERTEFLQELGRIRIQPSEKINVFVKKMDSCKYINDQEIQKMLHMAVLFQGSEKFHEYPFQYPEIEGDPLLAFRIKEKEIHGKAQYLSAEESQTADGTPALVPYINNIVQYVARDMQNEKKKYQEMLQKYGEEKASIYYKLEWFNTKGEVLEHIVFSDMDKGVTDAAKDAMKRFLDAHLDYTLFMTKAPDDERFSVKIDIFSREFMSLYKGMGTGEQVNTANSRQPWGMKAINNHLDSIKESVGSYYLKKLDNDRLRLVRIDETTR